MICPRRTYRGSEKYFYVFFIRLLFQIFPHDDLVYRLCCAGRRAGGGQLRDGLVTVRLRGGRLPRHEAQDEGDQGANLESTLFVIFNSKLHYKCVCRPWS